MMYNRFFSHGNVAAALKVIHLKRYCANFTTLSVTGLSSKLSAMFMEQCVPVKLSQYLLDFFLSSGSHVNLQL